MALLLCWNFLSWVENEITIGEQQQRRDNFSVARLFLPLVTMPHAATARAFSTVVVAAAPAVTVAVLCEPLTSLPTPTLCPLADGNSPPPPPIPRPPSAGREDKNNTYKDIVDVEL